MDVPQPHDDPFDLLQGHWIVESETAYHEAEFVTDSAALSASEQSQNALDAQTKMVDEKGKTAGSVSGGYDTAATKLLEQARNLATVASWMVDAAGKVRAAKKQLVLLVSTGTSEIKDALTSELQGTPASPSSTELTDKYRGDIASVASKLGTDLDAIGHSLAGTPGSSTTPSYISVPVSPSEQHRDHQGAEQVAAYNHGQSPEVIPQQLPPMPRAVTTPTTEAPSGVSTPSAPAAQHPTLSNLIGGQGTPTGSPGGISAPHTPSPTTGTPSTPSTPSPQSTEHRQDTKPAVAPHIPAVSLPDLPSIPLDTIGTVVSAATGHQLPTAAPSTITPSVPASAGFTPGVSGTSPVAPATPVAPTPLTPIGGGGLTPPAVTQPATPAPQAAPAAPSAASQQSAPPRSPAADVGWIQRTYGLAPGIESPKPEPLSVPALFITELPEDEVHLHRVLATLRQQFEQSGWGQPLALATLRRGFETKAVYATADAVSIHPLGILLPVGVIPLDEMPNAATHPDLAGSLMVTDKLKALVPRGWDIEAVLTTVPADEQHQSPEQYQELVESRELLPCTVSRCRSDVTDDEALRVFARAALGSGGCGELDAESARLRGSRWVGVQPSGYLEVLGRWYLSDAAESMSRGNWDDAVYCSERYLGLVQPKSQVA